MMPGNMPETPEPPAGPWRLFVALPLPEPLREGLQQWQRAAQRFMPEGLRWTPAAQWHLTLRFLGDVDPGEVSLLVEALEAACAGQEPMRLWLHGFGCFPSPERPRVFWLGLTGELGPLERLQARVQEWTAPWGQKEDRPFRAHLTVARIRDGSPAARHGLGRVLTRLPAPPSAVWMVDRVTLFRSQLLPEGAVHTGLHVCWLGGSVRAAP